MALLAQASVLQSVHKIFSVRRSFTIMVSIIGIATVVAGLVLLFAGAALSIYGVAVLGILVGGAGGYLFAPTIGGLIGLEGLVAIVAASAIGSLAGLVVTYLLLSMAVAAVSFVAGTYAGLVVVAPLMGEGSGLLVYPIAIVVGIVAAILGSFLTKSMMVLISSFVGATLASGSVTAADLASAQADLTLDPLLIDPVSPIFLVLFVFGVLTQFGLFKFGYVTKLVSVLPGASVLQDRGGQSARSSGDNR
jgi:hypothetical protein